MMCKRYNWLAIAAAALIFGGCSSTGTQDDAQQSAEVVDGGGSQTAATTPTTGGTQSGTQNGGTSTGSDAQTSGASKGSNWQGQRLNDPDSLLYTRKVYFDFDRSEIRSEFVSVLRAHAGYLAGNPSASVTIEGHCDERGSREYNIGLGERRADAIKRFLEAEGVKRSQITTISYGEERPDSLGHDEQAWAMNRRGVLVY